MLFTSLTFIIFLATILACNSIFDSKYHRVILLVSNIFFCASFGLICLICALTVTIIGYSSGRWIDRSTDIIKKRSIYIVTVALIVGTLIFSKYAYRLSGGLIDIVIPIGLSFYSFRNISYVVDVYKGMRSERDLIDYVDYSLFFPSFSSGPIDRYSDLIGWIRCSNRPKTDEINRSIFLIFIGIFKKCVVAGHMSYYTEWIFGSIHNYTGLTLIMAGVFYTIQIYADFSGYSDMAIGIAGLMGYKIKNNFRHPYIADGIGDFWRRWHISLSEWLRDYIYIPLGGSRKGKTRTYINLLITFLISGLWHGASMNFFIWGSVHGLLSVVDRIISAYKKDNAFCKILRRLLTFFAVSILWVVFKLTDIRDIAYYFIHIFDGIVDFFNYIMRAQRALHMDYFTLIRLILFISIILAFDILDEKYDIIEICTKIKNRTRTVMYTLLMLFIYLSLPVQAATEYIYFNF